MRAHHLQMAMVVLGVNIRSYHVPPSYLRKTFPGCHMTTARERRAEVALSPPSCLCQHNPFINGGVATWPPNDLAADCESIRSLQEHPSVGF